MSADPTPVTDDILAQIALSRSEYELARQRLGREPTPVELGMIGALWSEHCGYKHSRPLFRYFPTDGPQILTTLGSENAGAVDIGDGWVVVMKIESHNHPSAIEPYEGAATGVGGIVRDIFAMALALSLCSTRCASAPSTTHTTGTSFPASSPASAATATAWAFPTWAARWSSGRATAGTRW